MTGGWGEPDAAVGSGGAGALRWIDAAAEPRPLVPPAAVGGPSDAVRPGTLDGAPRRDTTWTLPAVVTSAISAGTVLGRPAFRDAAQIFLRGGLIVEASSSHADFFQKDMTALWAEQRAALAVYRPAGFVKVTLTT